VIINDRLSTKYNVLRRGVINLDSSFSVGGCEVNEITTFIFLMSFN